jgi:hypothetical protein
METIEINSFRELRHEECLRYTGGGFAYDAGRFIRFIVISAGGGINTAYAIADAVATQFK